MLSALMVRQERGQRTENGEGRIAEKNKKREKKKKLVTKYKETARY